MIIRTIIFITNTAIIIFRYKFHSLFLRISMSSSLLLLFEWCVLDLGGDSVVFSNVKLIRMEENAWKRRQGLWNSWGILSFGGKGKGKEKGQIRLFWDTLIKIESLQRVILLLHVPSCNTEWLRNVLAQRIHCDSLSTSWLYAIGTRVLAQMPSICVLVAGIARPPPYLVDSCNCNESSFFTIYAWLIFNDSVLV